MSHFGFFRHCYGNSTFQKNWWLNLIISIETIDNTNDGHNYINVIQSVKLIILFKMQKRCLFTYHAEFYLSATRILYLLYAAFKFVFPFSLSVSLFLPLSTNLPHPLLLPPSLCVCLSLGGCSWEGWGAGCLMDEPEPVAMVLPGGEYSAMGG